VFLNLPFETLRWKSKRYGIHCSLWLTLTFMIYMCHKAVYKCLHSRLLLISYSNVALNHWLCGNHSRSQYFPICDNESLMAQMVNTFCIYCTVLLMHIWSFAILLDERSPNALPIGYNLIKVRNKVRKYENEAHIRPIKSSKSKLSFNKWEDNQILDARMM